MKIYQVFATVLLLACAPAFGNEDPSLAIAGQAFKIGAQGFIAQLDVQGSPVSIHWEENSHKLPPIAWMLQDGGTIFDPPSSEEYPKVKRVDELLLTLAEYEYASKHSQEYSLNHLQKLKRQHDEALKDRTLLEYDEAAKPSGIRRFMEIKTKQWDGIIAYSVWPKPQKGFEIYAHVPSAAQALISRGKKIFILELNNVPPDQAQKRWDAFLSTVQNLEFLPK